MNPSSFGAKQYGEVAGIYDAIMHNVPHAKWLTRIESELRKRGKSPRSVLDMACGTGLVTELLDFRGYAPVVGFDISPQMIEIAKTKADSRKYPIEYHVQDAAELDLRGRQFDFAVSLFDSVNYILQPERLQMAFAKIHAHLNPGGVFAFDMNAVYAFTEDMFTQEGTYSGVTHAWVSEYDSATRLCRVNMIFKVTDEYTKQTRIFEEVHLQRGYEPGEMKQWLKDAGFVKIEAFGNYGQRAPNKKSDRILFFAEKL